MGSVSICNRHKRKHIKRLAYLSQFRFLALAVSILAAAYFVFPPLTGEAEAPIASASAVSELPPYLLGYEVAASNMAGRPVFPYSVIPGGVFNSKEMETALGKDPIAKEHYADFKVTAVRIVRVAADRKAYVSYRKGNRIYWTRKQVTLHEGETLLSDGEHLARTRCGNRISEVPHTPVGQDEPAETAADNPIPLHFPAITTDPLPAGPFWMDTAGAPVLLAALNSSSLPTPGGAGRGLTPAGMTGIGCCFGTAPASGTQGTPPLNSGLPPGSAPGSEPSPQPNPGPSPEPGPSSGPTLPGTPPVATPEPSTLLLLGAGLSGTILVLKLRRN